MYYVDVWSAPTCITMQIAANPLMLYPVTRLGEDAQLTIVDSSAYAGLGEAINWWQLVARCQEVGDVLIGYYAIPDHMDEPLNTVVDPLGMEVSALGGRHSRTLAGGLATFGHGGSLHVRCICRRNL